MRYVCSFYFRFRVVLLLCGGNIDTTIFGRCLERGLAAEGRLLKYCTLPETKFKWKSFFVFRFIVTVSDRPGGISDLCKLMASLGVSIKDIMHERAFIRDIYSVEVRQSISIDGINFYDFTILRWKWFVRQEIGHIRKNYENSWQTIIHESYSATRLWQ